MIDAAKEVIEAFHPPKDSADWNRYCGFYRCVGQAERLFRSQLSASCGRWKYASGSLFTVVLCIDCQLPAVRTDEKGGRVVVSSLKPLVQNNNFTNTGRDVVNGSFDVAAALFAVGPSVRHRADNNRIVDLIDNGSRILIPAQAPLSLKVINFRSHAGTDADA
jgi:hypothetical protein